MTKAAKKYLRCVSRRLLALPATRASLLAGLGKEIAERCPEGGFDDISAEFGAPARAAAELQLNVSEAELAAVSARQKKRTAILIGACAALALLLGLYVWYVQDNAIVIANETIRVISRYN